MLLQSILKYTKVDCRIGKQSFHLEEATYRGGLGMEILIPNFQKSIQGLNILANILRPVLLQKLKVLLYPFFSEREAPISTSLALGLRSCARTVNATV